MLLKEINDTVALVWSHTLARFIFLLIIFIALILSTFFSILSSVILITSYTAGCALSFCIIRYRLEVGFYLHRLVNFYYGHTRPKKLPDTSCNICDNKHCNRHRNVATKEPWKNLMVNEDLNDAVEKLYNKILENFITTWYDNFTDDGKFVNELRTSFRYATASLLSRYLQIDLGKLLANKLVPCVVRHIHDCLKIDEKSNKELISVKEAAIIHFGRRLHVAVTNRENELEYLRQLTTCILPSVLSKQQFDCKNFNILMREIIAGWVFLPITDAISDPNIINLLVNIAAAPRNTSLRNVHKKTRVELLHNFTNYNNLQKAALGYNLTRIFKTPEILYCFMQFLKEEGSVNILQFCLDVEEFSRKLLSLDLTEKDLENLHSEATQLYQLYLTKLSPDFIGCAPEICLDFGYLLQTGACNITKIRTSTPLYKAYDYAFSLLETKWLPLFYHSNDFYKLICGDKITSSYQKSRASRPIVLPQGSPPSRNRNRRVIEPTNPGTVSKISSGIYKIKGALRTQPIEGAIFPSENQSYETDPTDFIEPNIFRDLSTWRVSISHVEQTNGSKPASIFHVNIKRIDTCSEHERYWTVQRYDQDFYTLKIKLVEFHGENEICDSPLPSRRSTTPLETRKQKYEEFLQKLLQKPSLRGSDLLYTFLTTKENFTAIADTSVPLVSDLENIYLSVAHKLRKEKGQNLDTFMTTFLTSTETEKMKLYKFESPDVGEEADSGILIDSGSHGKVRDLKDSVFGDNFGVSLPDSNTYTPMFFSPSDIIQCSSYLLNEIFHAPVGVLRIFGAICNIAYEAVECFLRFYIEREVKSILPEHKLAHLVNMLEDALFEDSTVPPQSVLERRKTIAFQNINKMKNNFFCYWSGLEINSGFKTLLNILQHPQLNKQLTYSLLDVILMEFYPDCNFTEES